jgi:hypothetical protein
MIRRYIPKLPLIWKSGQREARSNLGDGVAEPGDQPDGVGNGTAEVLCDVTAGQAVPALVEPYASLEVPYGKARSDQTKRSPK